MMPVYLTHVDTGRNMARFYTMRVQPTLFGECAVVREWGRIGKGGQVRETQHTTPQEAQAFAAQILRQKVRKGYKIM
uniref:WGR domain-containing protein n=1 Tax=Neorhizobium sp. EC2-8 TaxID=3129230 RepID=UPI0031019F94